MNIAFIHAPFGHRKFSENLRVVDEEFILAPPIILAYVAAISKRAGHNVILIDAHALKLTEEMVLKKLKEFKPEIICFRVDVYNFHQTYKYINFIKHNYPTPIIVGGIGMTLYPKECMTYPEIDYGIIGESIENLPALLNVLESKSFSKLDYIPGLTFRKENKLIINPPDNKIIEFDSYPLPARELLPNEIYYSFVSQRKNFTIMLTSKGCPFNCIFCAIAPLKYLERSKESVIYEIEECYKKYKVREIDFFDATFFINRERSISIFEELIKKKFDLEWTCRSRVDIVDEEILKLASKAGCRMINFGIESASADVLKNIKKGTTIEQIKKALFWCKKYKIRTLGFLMIGNLGDTKETIKKSINFAIKLDFDYVQICRTIAKPDSELNKKFLINFLGKDFWSEYILGNLPEQRLPMPWTHLTNYEVECELKKAYWRFYFRITFIIKTLLKAKSFSEIVRYLKVGIKMVINYFYSDIK